MTLLSGRTRPTLATGRPRTVGRASLVATALIAGGLVATGGTVVASIMKHEAIVQHGRPVFIALAPVDPRALMQGDFMALRFSLPAMPTDLQNLSRLQVTATIDARNVASLKQISKHPATVPPGEVAIDLTFKGGWTVATDAFFFREGQATTFEVARFGEFRLKRDGGIVLVGLVDKDLRPLGR